MILHSQQDTESIKKTGSVSFSIKQFGIASKYTDKCFNIGLSYWEGFAPQKFIGDGFSIAEFGLSEDKHALPSYFSEGLISNCKYGFF